MDESPQPSCPNTAWPWLLPITGAAGAGQFISIVLAALLFQGGRSLAGLVEVDVPVAGLLVAYVTWAINLSIPKEISIDEFGIKGTIILPKISHRGPRHVEVDFEDVTSVRTGPLIWWVRSRRASTDLTSRRYGFFLSATNAERVQQAWQAWKASHPPV
jgi:hypothetical protein